MNTPEKMQKEINTLLCEVRLAKRLARRYFGMCLDTGVAERNDSEFEKRWMAEVMDIAQEIVK